MDETTEILTDPVLCSWHTETNLVMVPRSVEVEFSIHSTTDHLKNNMGQRILPFVHGLDCSDGAMFRILTVQPP